MKLPLALCAVMSLCACTSRQPVEPPPPLAADVSADQYLLGFRAGVEEVYEYGLMSNRCIWPGTAEEKRYWQGYFAGKKLAERIGAEAMQQTPQRYVWNPRD